MRFLLSILLSVFGLQVGAAVPGALLGGAMARPAVSSTNYSFTNNLWGIYRSAANTNFNGVECITDSKGTNHIPVYYIDSTIDGSIYLANQRSNYDKYSFAAAGTAYSRTVDPSSNPSADRGQSQSNLLSASHSVVGWLWASNYAGGIMLSTYDGFGGMEAFWDAGVSHSNYVCFATTNSGGGALFITNTVVAPLNQWVPWAYTWNSTNSTVSFMVNNHWVSGVSPSGTIYQTPACGLAWDARLYDGSNVWPYNTDMRCVFSCAMSTNQVADFVQGINSPLLALP